MLASQRLIDTFNEQIGHEMGASMQYIAIASYFDSETLPELAGFFYRQSEEERTHAMRFVKFINDVSGKVRLPAIPEPQSEFASAEEAVGKALAWEEEVTKQVYDLVEVARADKNYIAIKFLDWFVQEQLEEVSSMSDLLAVVRRAGSERLLFVEEYLVRRGGRAGSGAAPAEGGE